MTLAELRDAWIAAENARTEAYRAFMQATKCHPLRRELDEAERKKDAAFAAYGRALQNNNESPPDYDTPPWPQAAD